MSFPYIIQGNNLTIVIDNKPHTVAKTHITYEKLIEAIKRQEWDNVRDLIEPKAAVIKYGNGNVTIEGHQLFWRGKELHTSLAQKMITMLKEGFSIDPLVRFIDNLMLNPSKRAVDELHGFLEKGNLPITPDGHFLAYKKVRADYLDIHSGSVLNKPADLLTTEERTKLPWIASEVTVDLEDGIVVVSMPRNAVDDDKDRTCSNGLHFCSIDYLSQFGDETSKIVILKINPKDVVAIPSDHQGTKGRTSRYEIVSELAVDPDKAFTKPIQTDAVGSKAPKKAAPTKTTTPKVGSSSFKHGYQRGYLGFPRIDVIDINDQTKFDRGCNKGRDDSIAGKPQEYDWSGPKVAPSTAAASQDYDRYGNPLSMTKDAIRKRKARAEAKKGK